MTASASPRATWPSTTLDPGRPLMQLVVFALDVFFFLVLGHIILSWIPPGGDFLESVRRFFAITTEWLLLPLRRVIPPLRLGGAALDLSPLIVLIGVQVLANVLRGIA